MSSEDNAVFKNALFLILELCVGLGKVKREIGERKLEKGKKKFQLRDR